MFGRSRFESFFALVFGIAVTALSSVAMADPIVTMSPQLPVQRSSLRPGTNYGADNSVALTITRSDCKDANLKYTFNVSIANYITGQVLQAWAGASEKCTDTFNKSFTNCWKLGDLEIQGDATKFATIDFTPQQLFGFGQSVPVIPSCDYVPDNPGRQSFTVYFFFVSSSSLSGTGAAASVYFDMGGPASPENVSTGPAESSLRVFWTPVVDEGDVVYNFYCAPNQEIRPNYCVSGLGSVTPKSAISGSGGASSGGTSSGGESSGGASSGGTSSTTDTGGNAGSTDVGAGGSSSGGSSSGGSSSGGSSSGGSSSGGSSSGGSSSGGSSSGGSSSTSTAVDSSYDVTLGTQDAPDVFKCGSVRGKSSKDAYTQTILENYHSYAVSVTASDIYGNESQLATPVCATPVLVDTFFERYRIDGGKAGGGFCAFAPGRATLGAAISLLLALGAAAQFRRRSRRPS